jgi:hypothetical protein
LSTTRNKTSKKKGKKNTSLSNTQDTERQPNNLNLQVDEEFLASHKSYVTQTSITSFVEVDVKVKDDGQEKEWIGEALKNIKPMDTLSPLKPQ